MKSYKLVLMVVRLLLSVILCNFFPSQITASSPLQHPIPELAQAETGVSVTVPGSSTGTGTNILLNIAESIEIIATGSVNTYPENPENPWGGPDGNGYPCTSECLLPTAQFGALIGRVGNGEWFFVGSQKALVVVNTGELIFAVNDTISDNNIGSFSVILTKICFAPFFSQVDENWKNHPLRTSNNSCSTYCSTIGRCGCTLTTAAMAFNTFGANTDPPQLSDCMSTSACPFSWTVGASCSQGKALWISRSVFSWNILDQQLNQNHRPVILGMCKTDTCYLDHDDDPNTFATTHWVLVVSGHGSNPSDYHIHDPAFKCGANLLLSTRSSEWTFKYLGIYEGIIPCGSLTALIPPCVSRGANPQPVQFTPQTQLGSKSSETVASPASVISGTVWVYTRSAITMTLEVTASSSVGNISDMVIWSDNMPNTNWQPFTPFVWLPVSDWVYVRFRDDFGNVSEVYSDTINPVGPPTAPYFEIYLPLVWK